MLNLSNILDELTEEQMDRVLEFKAGGKTHGKTKTKSKSKSKSCSWTSGHK